MSGTYCSLIEQKEREDSFCREIEVKKKMEKRTEWRESGRKRSGRLVGVAESRGQLAESSRLQQKNSEHTGPAKKWSQ